MPIASLAAFKNSAGMQTKRVVKQLGIKSVYLVFICLGVAVGGR